MRVPRRLAQGISSCFLAWGCGSSGADDGEMEPASKVLIEAPDAAPSDEVERLAHDYTSGQTSPELRSEFWAALRRLSPEDFRRFRVAVADQNRLDGLAREIYEAFTDVLYEHRVFVFDAGPELQEEAMRRALLRHVDELGPEVVEQALQRFSLELKGPRRHR